MTQQDKDLLYLDLCARLPHGITCDINDSSRNTLQGIIESVDISYMDNEPFFKVKTDNKTFAVPVEQIKPYLRPISSLSQEERDKFCDIGGVISHKPSDGKLYLVAYFPEALDYLNSIHADYRGMIEKGLAIEVTDENNPYG